MHQKLSVWYAHTLDKWFSNPSKWHLYICISVWYIYIGFHSYDHNIKYQHSIKLLSFTTTELAVTVERENVSGYWGLTNPVPWKIKDWKIKDIS